MNEHKQSEGTSDPRSIYLPLAQWLQQVVKSSSDTESEDTNNQYHPYFYQQLPNFVMALLNKQPQATLHYAPLLYHLVGCTICHNAYLDLYTAMRPAIQTGEVYPSISSKTGTLEAIPARMVVQLSQSFIHQAEAVLRQARHEHTDNSALARSLLQQALRISTHVTQHNLRSQALQDLVRVANLADSPGESMPQGPAAHSYSPMLADAMRHARTVRRAETTMHPTGTPTGDAIYLQSNLLEGSITQHEGLLELHLRDLDKTLRSQQLVISVPLGSLMEPIRWLGGNPRAIRSVAPVDERGMLSTPLGRTDLQLSNPEDRRLLEATFQLLEVRIAS